MPLIRVNQFFKIMNSILRNILFIDIETVAQCNRFENVPDRIKPLWERKIRYYIDKEECSLAVSYRDKAAIYAEFGKVISIGLGYYSFEEEVPQFRVMSIDGDNEEELLLSFLEILAKFNQENLVICGHNIKEFDVPFLCRRLLLNGLKIPYVLDVSGRKPWEVGFIDTMNLWKFGDYKHYTSLDTLATIFDIPSSKSDIDGSLIHEVYYEEGNLKRISEYCKKDVVVTAQVFLKLKTLPILSIDQIVYI